MKVLVTGATGFIGRALIKNLLSESYKVKALVRNSSSLLPLAVQQVVIGDLKDLESSDPSRALQEAFKNVDTVVHVAARVHVMKDKVCNPLDEFRKVNLNATLVLARLSAEAGVKRFVFISSIKVNGEMTECFQSFKPDDVFVPSDPYGLSKYEAEKGLLSLVKETNMEVVIIRPPLVYGPGVKGNFARIMSLMSLGLPLPLGAIYNQRSMVALDNLISFISLCIDRKKSLKASNQIFLISDCNDISTTELLMKIRKALNFQSKSRIKGWLVPFPVSVMIFFAKLVGKSDLAYRLFGSLQVDSSKCYDLLNWTPVITMDEQLDKIVKEI